MSTNEVLVAAPEPVDPRERLRSAAVVAAKNLLLDVVMYGKQSPAESGRTRSRSTYRAAFCIGIFYVSQCFPEERHITDTLLTEGLSLLQSSVDSYEGWTRQKIQGVTKTEDSVPVTIPKRAIAQHLESVRIQDPSADTEEELSYYDVIGDPTDDAWLEFIAAVIANPMPTKRAPRLSLAAEGGHSAVPLTVWSPPSSSAA